MAEETLGAFLAAALARKKLTGQDLARAAGLNKNTVSALLNDRIERPSRITLSKIETALGLTPGTLAAIGEDAPAGAPAERPDLGALSDADLIGELGYRLTRLQRENDELSERVAFLAPAFRDAFHRLSILETGGGIEGYDPEAGTQDGIPLDDLSKRRRPDVGMVDRAADDRTNRGRALREHLDGLGEEPQGGGDDVP